YRALRDIHADEDTGNALRGPVVAREATNLFVQTDGPPVFVGGVDALSIVVSEGKVFVAPIGSDDIVKSMGAQFKNLGPAVQVSDVTRRKAYGLVRDQLSVWAERAWDTENGGFVEALDFDGRPRIEKLRRVRVQARQIFSFAEGVSLGLDRTGRMAELVSLGVTHLRERWRLESGCWASTADHRTKFINAEPDLYDHAFIVLAGASAYRASEDKSALSLAEDALSAIETQFADTNNGGYFESPSADPSVARRSNPHMHLLEALLALEEAVPGVGAIEKAGRIVELFETKFFDSKSDRLVEYFRPDWQIASDAEGLIVEPGHHYEWATLLALYQQKTGRDLSSWGRRMIRFADRVGRSSTTGFAVNQIEPGGAVIDGNHRLWHQLEDFRSRLYFPETINPRAADILFDKVYDSYVAPTSTGLFFDRLNSEGQANAEDVPASMLYHFITALSPLVSAISKSEKT
ncbi:MAG: AGE family epimerase/isomerase, partial [Pseudomonadota bacterium]